MIETKATVFCLSQIYCGLAPMVASLVKAGHITPHQTDPSRGCVMAQGVPVTIEYLPEGKPLPSCASWGTAWYAIEDGAPRLLIENFDSTG